MSLPPPSSSGQREHVLDLEGPRRRRGQLRLSAMGATISFDGALRTGSCAVTRGMDVVGRAIGPKY